MRKRNSLTKAYLLLAAILVALLSFLLFAGCSGEISSDKKALFFREGELEYVVTDVENKSVKLISYLPEDAKKEIVSFTIGGTVEHEGETYSVTAIGACAFWGIDVAFVTIEEGIETIEQYAFAHSSAQEIELPNSLKKINEGAFYDCVRLQEVRVTAPNPPTLGGNAFSIYHRVEKKILVPAALVLKVPFPILSDYESAWEELKDNLVGM